MKHEKFTYKSLDDVKAKCKELGVTIPFADNTECLSAPIRIGNREIPNRLGIAPMEGADSTPDGKPSEYSGMKRFQLLRRDVLPEHSFCSQEKLLILLSVLMRR